MRARALAEWVGGRLQQLAPGGEGTKLCAGREPELAP